MNCTLTIDQQKQLFKKVFVDLTSNKDFTFNITEYVEDFYDMINDNTNDPALALSYVSLLPQTIRVNIGVNKNLSSKYGAYFPQIVELENRFINIDAATDYIEQIKTIKTGLANIQQEMQDDSLRADKNTEIVEETTEPEIKIEPATGLSDLTFENTSPGEETLSPDKKLYANVKRQLIKNAKSDGTSYIESFGMVKLQAVSTQLLEDKDLYPDTLRQLQSSDEATKERVRKANENGAVLIVTDLDNKIIYFDENVKPVERAAGKPAYFLFRNPQPNKESKFVLSDLDKLAIRQMTQDLNLTPEEATQAYYKKIGVYKNMRAFINQNPKQNRLDVNITGGFTGVPVKPDLSLKTPLASLNLGSTVFFPQEGVEAKGQNTQSYYFDLPNIPVPIQIKRPDVTKEFAEKLASLMFDDVYIEQRGNKFPLAAQEKRKIFEQFFYTSPITISFEANPDNSLTMRKFGEVISLDSPEAYKTALVDYLTRLQPTKELKANQVGTRKVITDLSEAKSNFVYKISINGNERYFLIQPAQLEISKAAIKNNSYQDFTLDTATNGVILRTEQKPYTSFIKSNFIINYPLDSTGNIQTVNAVLNFDLPIQVMSKIRPNKKAAETKVEEIVKTPAPSSITDTDLGSQKKMNAKDFLATQRKKNPDAFNKLIDQRGLEATEKQIEDAMKWYSKHPMKEFFNFEAAFNVVNLNNPTSIATWTTNGITLYKGSDFSDLYHEAWHGFTQGFLTKDEKTALYNEMRTRSGMFIDYTGKRVSFTKATELQLEEFLAEDFREYMLSDGKTVLKNATVRNSIFRRILNFLRSLFGNMSYNQIVMDDQVSETVKDLYDKLRIGDLTSFSFAVENRNFNTLNKGMTALNKIDAPSLSFENTKLMMDSINSLFSEYADMNNAYSDEGVDGPKQTYKYTTKLFETTEGLSATYEYVAFRLEELHGQFSEQYKETPTDEIKNKIDMLKWALRSFGDIQNLMRNGEEGVIGYHITNSDYIPNAIKEELQDEIDLVGRETEGKQYYDRGGNETPIFDLANKEIINIIKGLPKYDSNDQIVKNKLGLPELNPFKETFAHIAKTVQNLSTPQRMYEALEKETVNYPTIKHLLEKLGPVEYPGQSLEEVNNWTRFWQSFNKYRIPLVQTTVNEITSTNPSGAVTATTYEIQIGNALADFRRVGQRWENMFVQEQSNPFIKNDNKGNYLDIAAVLVKYPSKNDIKGKEFEFLRDIGIGIKDTKTIRNELKREINAGTIKLGGIYDNIITLNTNGIQVRSISRIVRRDDVLGIAGEAGANGNYGKLEKLQYRYGDEDSDFMVANAAGDPQSEFSQNTTLTQFLKFINEAKSYSELISNPQMSFLNKTQNEPGMPYNAFIESSVWIKSLFNMSEPGGPKYPGAEINVKNLSGTTKAINGINVGEGSISTELDEYSKLIQDFHIQLMAGTPELTRHAGKKTSLAVAINNYKTYSGKETPYLYIDTADFAVQMGDVSKGYAQGIQIIMPYVISEVKRINYAKYLLTDEANVKVADFGAIKRAAEFSKLSGVLSKDTQDKLLEIKGDIDAYMNSTASINLRNQIESDIIEYFGKQYAKVEKKFSEAEYISPSLYNAVKNRLTKDGQTQWAYDVNVRQALINSFVWNTWINHFEESNILYGDPSLYKNEQDFFKRNAALNSTGNILRTDAAFNRHVNEKLGRPLATKLGASADVMTYNSILNTAVVSDVEVASAYYEQYKKELDEVVIDDKYGDGKVNEADAAAFVSYDTYRIIRSALGNWDQIDEDLYQKELNGEKITNVDKFPAVVKMGMYGPLQTSYLPLVGLHKFALFPLIPSVIKGTNLENLHNKMMMEGIDYLTFKSGSKISTITNERKSDKLYSDTTKRVLSDIPFTKNPIYADYLKDQVEASTHYKGKVSFFTQLRKLIDTGIMENGMPVDYKGTKADWEGMSIPEQIQASPKFKKRYEFLHNLDKLQQYKRQELLKELGWKIDKNGKPTGDIKPLLELISRELKRRDFPQHTLQFIQTITDNEVKNSLDISQFAEQIEGVVTAVINKRLVNYKVNGEQLVQVAGTGFENLAFAYGENRSFEKPTAEELSRYGTNDLPTYHKKADGSVAAAKVKIAIQGQFKNLLKLDDVVERATELKITPLQALNTLLKDDGWLDSGDHRRMITMIGARIPTQGLNSMEFAEVYEFLPEEAGSIIIAPSEITAKSGTDYDYDKLPMMMPSIKVMAGKVSLAKEYTRQEARKIYDTLVDFGINKLSLQGVNKEDVRKFLKQERFDQFEDAVIKLLGDDYLQRIVEVVKEDQGLADFDDFYERLNGSSAIENNIIKAGVDILSDPSNFANLIRPNSTELVEPIAKEIIAPLVTDPDLLTSTSKGTAIFEPLKNLQIHQSNTIGKRTLGIVAVENIYKSVFNGIGMKLNPTFTKGVSKKVYRADILLPHNKDEKSISLGNLKDAAGENNIADVISQLMNGTVDVEKDDWVSFIQMNEEVAPVMLFLTTAGVPIKDIIYFVSQPLIRKYVVEQRLYKSSLSNVLGKVAENPKQTRFAARNAILSNIAYDFQIGDKITEGTIYDQTINETKDVKTFDREGMLNNLKFHSGNDKRGVEFRPNSLDRQTFLHYLELENLTNFLTGLKKATDVDRNVSNTLFEMEEKSKDLAKVGVHSLLPEGMIEKIRNDSAIAPYFIQNFATDVFGRLFPLRNNVTVNEYLSELGYPNDLKGLFGENEREKMVRTFKNDLVSYIFQDSLRKFSLSDSKTYKNTNLKITKTENLPFGAVVRGNELIVDKNAIENNYYGAEYEKEGLTINTFRSLDEYTHYVLERESLRPLYSLSSIKDDMDYKAIVTKNLRKADLREEGQTDEQFKEKVEKMSYDEWLRNKALYNILNPWIMFRSGASVADKLMYMMDKYPSLRANYSLLKGIRYAPGREAFRNLRLAGAKIDGLTAEIYHENLKDLAENSIQKVDDPIDNKYISDYFKNFSIWMFMQAGLAANNPYSFNKVISQDTIVRLLDEPYKKVLEEISSDYLDKFYRLFIIENAKKSSRLRSKDYLEYTKREVDKPVTEAQEENQQINVQPVISQPEQKVVISDEELTDLLSQCYR